MWTESQYDAQIKELTEQPSKIFGSWGLGVGLFRIIGDGRNAGCLTTIRHNANPTVSKAIIKGVINEELTAEIQADERIPKMVDDIKPEHLSIFKEWQMRIDVLQNN